MKKKKSEIIFRIILPFWVDVQNHTKFKKIYKKLSYDFEIMQDLWLIDYHSKLGKRNFMVPEHGVIDRNYMKPKYNYDDLNAINLSLEKDLDIDGNYNVSKLKSVLSIIIKTHELKSEEEILTYIKSKGIWQDLRNLVNYFLSIYTHIRINSDFKRHYVHLVGDDYYSNENVTITYKQDSKSKEVALERAYADLEIRYQWQHNTVMINKQTLEYFKDRFSKNKSIKLDLHERLEILIDYAKKSRDINSLIIYVTIYLERRYIQYLSKMKDMSIEDFEILFEKRGLRHFVEEQLPYNLGGEIDAQIINDTRDVVIKRNLIVHRGIVFVYDKELVEKCNNVINVIEHLEGIIYPDKEQAKFSFDKLLVGVILEVDPNRYVGMMPFESLSEVDYFAKNAISMKRINDDFLKQLKLVNPDYEKFELGDSFKGYCKIFHKDDDYKIIFSLNPVHLYMNFKFFDNLVDFLKEQIKPNIFDVTFLITNMPKCTMKLFKKGIEKKIKDIEVNLGWKSIKYECMMIFKLKDDDTKNLFYTLIDKFKQQENKIILDKALAREFSGKNYLNILESYPNLFSKKDTEGEIAWELIKDITPKDEEDN